MSATAPRENLRPIGTTSDRTVYYDEGRGTYHTWCEDDAYEPVSTALLMTVSSVLGVEPDDLEALSECVEPDALNALFIHWRGDEPRVGDGSISFTFSQCSVTVRSDGEIVIDPTRQQVTPETTRVADRGHDSVSRYRSRPARGRPDRRARDRMRRRRGPD